MSTRSREPEAENLTIAETAIVLRCSEKKVRCLVKAGRLPAAQIGRQWIIPKARLDRFIEELIQG